MGRKHCKKRKNCSLQAISPFPAVFFFFFSPKDLNCREINTRACLEKGETIVWKRLAGVVC